jgi:hypothetical protein
MIFFELIGHIHSRVGECPDGTRAVILSMDRVKVCGRIPLYLCLYRLTNNLWTRTLHPLLEQYKYYDLCFFPLSHLALYVSSNSCTVTCSCTFHLLSLILSCHSLSLASSTVHLKRSRYSDMPQQPTQTGQWPIPGPPQPPSVPSRVRPYPVDLQTHLYNQFAPEAHPYPVPPPQHWGGYPQGVGVPPAQAQRFYPSAPPSVQPFYNQYPAQGLGPQVPVLPVYSAASPLVQPYYQHTQQGLGQPPPVVAAEESAVKRGKRKAVDVDDARPLKKQAIKPFVNDVGFVSAFNVQFSLSC